MALITPFAQNGDKKAIPQNTSDGSVSFDRGFGSFYALPPEEGGLFIDRAQFNQLMFDTTSEILANKQSLSNLSSSTYNKSEVDNRLNVKIDSTKASKILTENLVKTVGASGADFVNLRQALEWASQYSYSGGRFSITLRCNADMPIPGIYLPIGEALIIIDGQNNTFNCNNDYFFTAAMATTHQASGFANSNLLIKNFTLNYNGITTSSFGCAFQLGGINVTFDNITININNSNIKSNLIVNQFGKMFILSLNINCRGTNTIRNILGIYSGELLCSSIKLNLSELTGQINNLFYLQFSRGLFNFTNETPTLPTDKISAQISLTDGSLAKCDNKFNNSKLSVAPNTLTANGIIFK